MLMFLDQRNLAKAVRGLSEEPGALRIAVAFWGHGALQQLGIPGKASLKVLCNLEAGATNPAPIKDLLKRKVNVKTNPRLHAKVYASDTRVIIGSSNASSNGLALEGRPLSGWIEANVLSDDPPLVAKVHGWFDDLWDDAASGKVTPAQLNWAELLWKSRPKGRVNLQGARTLSAAFRANPGAFQNVRVAVYDRGLSDAAKQAHRKNKKSFATRDDASDQPKLIRTYPFEDFDLPDGVQIIDISVMDRSKPRLTGYLRNIDVEIPLPQKGVLQLARPQRGILIDSFPKPLRLSPEEIKAIYRVLPTILPKRHGFGGRLLTLDKVLRAASPTRR